MLLIFAGIAHSGGPLLVILVNYLMGTLKEEMWIHPFKGMYVNILMWYYFILKFSFLFNSHDTPGYQIGYGINILYNVYVASYFSAIDTFYVGCCVYAMAQLEHLKDHFIELDEEFEMYIYYYNGFILYFSIYIHKEVIIHFVRSIGGTVSERKFAEKILGQKMIEGIKMHHKILE